jgi:hypothetical protein
MSTSDGTFRLAVVAGGIGIAWWLGGDYIGGALQEASRQISGDFSGGGQVHPGRGVAWQPPFDPFGLRPSGGQHGYASVLSPGVGFGQYGTGTGYDSRGFYGSAGGAYGGGYGYRRGSDRYRECSGPARSLSCRDIPAWGGRW